MSDVLNENRVSGGIVRGGSIGGDVEQRNSVNGGEVARNRGGTYDYEVLENHPLINGEELIGDKSNEDLHIAAVKTSAEWAELTTLVSVRGEVYVYSDYQTDEHGNDIPGVKMGDGLAYVVDLPFVAGTDYRISQEDIENWNNKVAVRLDGETLIFY